jgi:hypothetical protein
MDDLFLAQKRLGRTLERASIGEDRQLAQTVREKGEGFANLFFSLLRMTRIYELNNESFRRPVEELNGVLGWLLDNLGVVHLVAVEDQIYINDIRIRFKADASPTQQLGPELRKHNVGSVTFHQVMTHEALLPLFAALGGPPAESQPRTAINQSLAQRGSSGVELGGVNRYLMAGEEQLDAQWTEVLGRAAELVEETWNDVAAGRMLNPLSLRRMVVELLSSGVDHDGLWQPVPGSTEHGPHAVRVCRLALLTGQGVGLSDRHLQDLGVTALVHDVGYTTVPPGVQGGTRKRHLSGGALVMLRQRGFHEAKLQRILGTLYHHHDFKNLKDVPSLFARILRVAEDFDNMCHRGEASPPAALAGMVELAGEAYDPVLLQVLVNRLGRYPPGTYLDLEDGRQVRVVAPNRAPETFDRPRTMTRDGQIVDLAKGGKVARVVVQ